MHRTSVTFCALCALLWTSGAAPVPTAPASEEEVNVLMFGVLQFGDSMRHMYQSIETKLDRIRRNILNTQGLVERLGQETQEAQQAEAQIREGLNHIQTQTAGLWAETQQVRGLVNKAEQEEQRLKRKLRSLENKLRAASPDNIKTLKETTLRHSVVLKDLVDWTLVQKQRLDVQEKQLTQLQKQTES